MLRECKAVTEMHKQLPFKDLCRIQQKSFSKVDLRKAESHSGNHSPLVETTLNYRNRTGKYPECLTHVRNMDVLECESTVRYSSILVSSRHYNEHISHSWR